MDGATGTAVASIRPPEGDKLLSPEADYTVTPVTRSNQKLYFVNHSLLPYRPLPALMGFINITLESF
jgi:hypothetical protein